jgi:hydroxymethylpyrimidine/phosphomethylpyrimidine kinase
MQTVLTIAGFDPSSGAGVTADLMVFAAHGLFGTSCITALTVQSTVGVQLSYPVSPALVEATLECLDADLPPAGVKIGMLASAANIHAVSDYLEKLHPILNDRSGRPIPVVLDPVLRSSSGRELLDAEGLITLGERLLPLVDWITPNLDELAVLTGEAVVSRDDLPYASLALQGRIAGRHDGSRPGILSTGGHLDPPDDFLLMPSGEGFWLPGERVATRATHGTGCALSSAFLSRLVLGDAPPDAARAAKAYVAGALRTSVPRGAGASAMNHLWTLNKA